MTTDDVVLYETANQIATITRQKASARLLKRVSRPDTSASELPEYCEGRAAGSPGRPNETKSAARGRGAPATDPALRR